MIYKTNQVLLLLNQVYLSLRYFAENVQLSLRAHSQRAIAFAISSFDVWHLLATSQLLKQYDCTVIMF